MIKSYLLLLLLVAASCYRGASEIPIVNGKDGHLYAQLRIGGWSHPTILVAMDFNSTESWIDPSVAQGANQSRYLEVMTPAHLKLGFMNFTIKRVGESLGEHKGSIGLGLNSPFFDMLEKNFHREIGLRFQLISGKMLIEKDGCRDPKKGPFKVSVTTWTTINYLTPMSFNFHPSEDFLALLNKTHNNFHLPS